MLNVLTAQVPLVPLTPGASILINVFLMMKLSFLTWIRFTIWIAIGTKTRTRIKVSQPKLIAVPYLE